MDLAPRRPWRGTRIVLGVTGGIAAYKSVQLARDLTRLGVEVDTVLTRGARNFVQPLTFEAVTGRPVHTELFRTDTDRGGTGGAAEHIRLGHNADVVCVAPATADFIARAARGRADDLLTTTLLATRAPVLLCPAMNDVMFAHPQVGTNLDHCRDELGYEVAGPGTGPLAYGEGEGPGRMLEPSEIVEYVGRALERARRAEDAAPANLAGRRVIVTAGPTREAVDPVRFLSNRSSGRMGFALAQAAWRRGADVVLVSGPVSLDDPVGVRVVRVETAVEMEAVVRKDLSGADVAIFAAAVADYRPAAPGTAKIKRAERGDEPTLSLTVNPDVSAGTRDVRKEGAVVVGFALETGDLVENAREKLERKGFDLIVANPVGENSAFESETNRITVLRPEGEPESLPLGSKDALADDILDRVEDVLRGRTRGGTA